MTPFKLHTFLLCCFLSGAVFLPAQNDWQQGYVVTLSGDTLHGMVRDRNTGPFGGLYSRVHLKQDRKRKVRFRPDKMQAYRWGDVQFVVLHIALKKDFFNPKRKIDPNGIPKVFRLVEDGPLRLYWDEFNDEDNFQIEAVPYFQREGDPQLVRATQGIFGLKKKLLSEYFADRPDLVGKIQSGAVKTTTEVLEAYGEGGAE